MKREGYSSPNEIGNQPLGLTDRHDGSIKRSNFAGRFSVRKSAV